MSVTGAHSERNRCPTQAKYSRGWSVRENSPFAGSIVPLPHYGKERRVASVMVEINRSLIMDEATGARKASRPVVGRATSFHHHVQRRAVVERARECVARQPATFDDARIGIGERKFEHVLGEVDGDRGSGRDVRRSMHGGLLF